MDLFRKGYDVLFVCNSLEYCWNSNVANCNIQINVLQHAIIKYRFADLQIITSKHKANMLVWCRTQQKIILFPVKMKLIVIAISMKIFFCHCSSPQNLIYTVTLRALCSLTCKKTKTHTNRKTTCKLWITIFTNSAVATLLLCIVCWFSSFSTQPQCMLSLPFDHLSTFF